MGNMSYCRFQNTLGDLRDCEDALDHPDEPLSPDEARARQALIELCARIAEDFGDDQQ